jgi:enoyl-CoA hydratase/carnithine racemase
MSNVWLEVEGQLAVVTLKRPERRNALSFDLMVELIGCLDGIGGSRTIERYSMSARI